MKVSRTPISTSKNFWVVRAGEKAEFYNHFRLNGVIAIGHTEGFDLGSFNGVLSDEDKNTIINKYKVKLSLQSDNKSFVSRQVGQVKQFVTLLKEGDTVLTITDKLVVAGIVKSKCYYDDTIIPLEHVEGDEGCHYPLRYDVEWGKTQSREHIPYTIDKSFRNSGTVFKLSGNDKIKVLNHWLNPIHFLDGEVRCSINIMSENLLSNRSLTNISAVYDKLELLAAYFESINEINDANIESFSKYIKGNSKDFDYQLTAQHEFMSPGFQFIQLKGTCLKNTTFALGFACIFNCQISFAEENENDALLTMKVTELTNFINSEEVQSSIDVLKAKMPSIIIDDVLYDEPVESEDAML